MDLVRKTDLLQALQEISKLPVNNYDHGGYAMESRFYRTFT